MNSFWLVDSESEFQSNGFKGAKCYYLIKYQLGAMKFSLVEYGNVKVKGKKLICFPMTINFHAGFLLIFCRLKKIDGEKMVFTRKILPFEQMLQ